MGSLVRSGQDLLSASRDWAGLLPEERRRRAAAACRDRDAKALWELTSAYLTLHGSAGSRVSQHTLEAYRISVEHLLRRWKHVNLLRPTHDDAAMLVRTMEQEGLSASTIQVRLAGARMLYRALRWTEVLDSDPLADVRPAKDPTPAHEKRHPYSDDAVEKLLPVADETMRLLILLAAHAGLRISEALDLEWPDVRLDEGSLVVRRGKGRKMRTCPLSRRLHAALMAKRQQSGRVIGLTTGQVRRRLKALCQETGVEYLGVHAFRHTAGTRLYRQTGKLEEAQALLGHSSISTTQIYAKWSDEGLKRALSDW